jgi:hypothetical protein
LDIRTISASDDLLKSLGKDNFYAALWKKYRERLEAEGLETTEESGTVDAQPSLIDEVTDYTFRCKVQKIQPK